MKHGVSRWLPLIVLLGVAGCGSQAQQSPGASLLTPTITPVFLLPAPLANPAGGPGRAASSATPSALAVAPGVTVTSAVPILMYHQIKDLPANASADDLTWTVSPKSLDAQLGFLAENGYATISLDQLLDGLAGRATLPPKAVVLTFDDGWKTQYINALPLLKQRKQTATFYVVSSYIGYSAYFSWAMVQEIQESGMTIAGHTVDHASLTGLSLAQVERELRDSKTALEQKLGLTVAHFAYPNGAYNDAVVEAVKRAGYRSATTINPLSVKNPVSPYLLPRLRVSYQATLADFAKKLP